MAVEPDEKLDFLDRAKKRFEASEERYSGWRKSAGDSFKFIVGDQWDDRIKKFRQADKRPCITVNRLAQMTRLVSNQIHRTKPAMKVLPVDSKADVGTAEKIMGVIRHIERNSNSGFVYGNGVDGQVKCGLGFIGFETHYSKRGSFEMDVGLRAFRNSQAVFPDANAQEFDLSDAGYYFVIDEMAKEEFHYRFPKSEIVNADLSYNVGFDDWMTKDTVRVAEYWYVEKKTEKLYKLKNGQVGYREDFEVEDAEEFGAMVDDEREEEVRTVHRALINGHEVLEEDEWPGAWIPIIPIFGEVTYVDGKPVIQGLIENGKEPQRMINYLASSMVELIALTPKTPWIIASTQLKGHERSWKAANTKSFAYLQYEPVDTATGQPYQPPQRNTFEPPIQHTLQGMRAFEDGLQHGVGLDAPSLGQLSSERSGAAIAQIKESGVLGTYHYVINLSHAIRFAVKQLIGDGNHEGLIQKIYHEPGRILRIIGEDDAEEMIGLGSKDEDVPQGIRGQDDFKGVYDLGVGLYDVVADVGQAFGSQRQEAFNSLMQVIQSNPDLLKVIGDIVFKYADTPGGMELSKRFRKMMPPELTGEKPQIPPELEQQMKQAQEQAQQMQGQLQQMGQALEEKERIIQSKQIESDSKERIAQAGLDSKESIEKGKQQLEQLTIKLDALKTFSDALENQEKRASTEQMLEFKEQMSVVREDIKTLGAEKVPPEAVPEPTE